jgi:hypothetical protein
MGSWSMLALVIEGLFTVKLFYPSACFLRGKSVKPQRERD